MFCDSNLELWYDKVEKLGLKVISMPYLIDDKEEIFDLGETTDFANFYNKIKKGSMPLTQALNPQNYIDYFEPYLKQGQDILYVHFSNKLSGTFEFLNKAIEELKQKYPERSIKTVDTLSISIGAASLLYEAAKLHNSGASDEEVIAFVKANRNKYAAYFVVDDLNHLKRGGRLSSTKAFMGSLMNVKPILTVNSDGVIVPVDKAKGKIKAMLALIERLKEEGQNVLDHPIIIAHANAEEEANFLLAKIKEYLGEEANIWVQAIGPTIGTHCGPGTFAISFRVKARKN
jgi:DegV family protein with EDD domain